MALRSLHFTAGNDVVLLQNGAEFFPALLAALASAREEIFLETYIFQDDPTGQQVKAALLAAAARGVFVNVVVDWHGTGRVAVGRLQADFAAGGVNFRAFNPWFRRGIARTHRKIVVVDGQVALLGGLNIIDDLRDDADPEHPLPSPRWDIAARIRGPLVQDIHLEAAQHWARIGPLRLLLRWELLHRRPAAAAPDSGEPMQAALVVRDNLRNRRTIQRAYLHALGHARSEALLANPYFAPGRKLRTALAKAARRGVDVTLLLGVGQFRLQDAVAQSYYPGLLAAGVKIVEYQRTQLHGKVAVVDGEWATLGSSNVDGLSLFVNQEANIVVRDAAFCATLRQAIHRALADGRAVDPACVAKAPWYRRLWYGFAYLLYKNVLRVISLGSYAE